ncbi:MAG TPA: hypothetical protein VIE40_00125, partial [Dehalococcoidia bacterium]
GRAGHAASACAGDQRDDGECMPTLAVYCRRYPVEPLRLHPLARENLAQHIVTTTPRRIARGGLTIR